MNEITPFLWVGTLDDVRTQSTDHADRIISVCQDASPENVSCPYEHFELADGEPGPYGGECTYSLFKEAANSVLCAMRNFEVVVCHCHSGASRSVATATAALAVYRDISYWEAYQIVEENRPQAHPNHVLVGFAKQYIDEADTGTVHQTVNRD